MRRARQRHRLHAADFVGRFYYHQDPSFFRWGAHESDRPREIRTDFAARSDFGDEREA